MRARLTLALLVAALVSSCGGGEGSLPTLTTGTTAGTTTTGETTTTTMEAPRTMTTQTTMARTTTTTMAPVRTWAWSRLRDSAWGAVPGVEPRFSGLIAAGAGLVIVGADSGGGDGDAVAWISSDGFTWSRVPHDEAVFGGAESQAMGAAAVGGPGLVAVGLDNAGGDGDAAVWVSADGVAWSRAPHDEAVFGGAGDQRMTLVAAAGPGFVALGTEDAGGTRHVAVWVSADGTVWSRVARDEAVFGASDSCEVGGLVVFGGQLVAVGSHHSAGAEGDGDAAVWVSADGVVWSRVAHDEAVLGGAGNQYMMDVTTGGPGLVAVGYDDAGGDGDAAVWVSADGVAWSRVPHNEAVFGGAAEQTMSGVVLAGGGLMAVGRDDSGGDFDAVVWSSSDGLAWSRSAPGGAVFGGPGDQIMERVLAAGSGMVVIGLTHTDGFDGAMWVAVPATWTGGGAGRAWLCDWQSGPVHPEGTTPVPPTVAPPRGICGT